MSEGLPLAGTLFIKKQSAEVLAQPFEYDSVDKRTPDQKLYENNCFIVTAGGRGLGEVLFFVRLNDKAMPLAFCQLYEYTEDDDEPGNDATPAGRRLAYMFGFKHYALKRGNCVFVPLSDITQSAHLLEDFSTGGTNGPNDVDDYFRIANPHTRQLKGMRRHFLGSDPGRE